MQAFAIVFAIIVFLVVFIGAMVVERRRRQGMAVAAQELSMAFHPQDESGIGMAAVAGFSLAEQGHGRKVINTLHAEAGELKTRLFDYHYSRGSGKSQTNYYQTVIGFEHPGWDFPRFVLRPERFWDNVKGRFGAEDIDFDDSPVFSKKYFLQGPEEARIRQLFHGGLRDFFTQHLNWYIEADGNRIILCQARQRRKPAELITFLKEGLALKDELTASL